MNVNRYLVVFLVSLVIALTALSLRLQAQTGCSPNLTPFTDLGSMSSAFCASVFEAYFSGLTSGTSPTTYTPGANVTRDQMSAFVTRTLDQSLKRGSRRAALNQWWKLNPTVSTLPETLDLITTPVGLNPHMVASDGADVWVANWRSSSPGISRVRASDGKLLESINLGTDAWGVLIAMGRVFVTPSLCASGTILIMIDPKTDAQTTVADLGTPPKAIAFDGTRIWIASDGLVGTGFCSVGSVSIVTPGSTMPWSVTTITSGFIKPYGMLYDGSNIWVTDKGDNTIKKLDSSGGILQTITVGSSPGNPVFDGINIWVPNFSSNNVTVIRAKDGAGNTLGTAFVLQTLSAPFMSGPESAAFDGERVLITCRDLVDALYLFKATDLSLIAAVGTGDGTDPWGVCSDGLNFWVTLSGTDQLMRF